MKILFTGDINFRGITNLDAQKSKQILTEVKPYIDASDFVIPNLECPLAEIDKYPPIKKSGPNLICTPDNICLLKEMNATAVTLANNHIGDFGDGALKDTLALLKENNISYCGAESNIEKAYDAIRLTKDSVTVSVLSVCENEFGMATENSYGAAVYNPRLLLKRIREEKSVADYVVVVFHGGNEFNPLPSPDTAERYRLICDMGADAVVGGHTHCPQGYEIYDGKPIIYSMGNFFFRSRPERKVNISWNYGYFTVLEFADTVSAEITPYNFDVDNLKLSVFQGNDKEKMMDYIEKLSRIIKDNTELEKYFCGWAYNHQWFTDAPEDFTNPVDYDASFSYNLVKCEAHLSQLQKLYSILHNERLDEAKLYSEKIKLLEEMPL